MSVGDLKLGLVIGARADGTVRRSFNAVDREVDQTRKNLKTLGVQREATKSVVTLRKELLTLRKASLRAGDGNEGLQRKIKSVAAELERAERKATDYGVDIKNIARETHRLASETQQAERSLESFSRRQGVVQSRNEARAAREHRTQVGQARSGIAGLAPNQRLAQLDQAESAAKGVVRYRTELLRLNRAQRKAGGSNKELAHHIDRVGDELRQAERAAERYGVDVRHITSETRRLGRESRQARREIDRLAREQREQERRARGAENRRQMGRVAAGAAAVAGTAAAVGGTRQALDFRRESVRLKTAVSAEDIDAAVEESREAAMAFAAKTGFDAAGILRIEYALNSAGFEAEAARAGGRVAAQVARVTNGADERVAEVVASVYNNLGDQFEGNVQEKLARVGDLLTKTQLKFQFRNFDQLGESLSEALPATISNNIALEETLTLLGLLNGAGLRGGRAGTAFTATLRQMSKAADEFGFELARGDDGALDVIATLNNLNEAIGGIDNIDQATRDALQKEFGEEGIRMVNLLLPKLAEIPAALEDVDKNAKGIFNRKDQLFVDDPSGEIERMQKNFGLLTQSIADAWLPAAGDAANAVADLLEGLVEFSREHPNWTKAITAVAGAMTGAKLASAAWFAATGRQGKALSTLVFGGIPQLIGQLGKLKGAKMRTAAQSFLGSPLTKARWTTWLGRAGAIGAAGAVGYAIGSVINSQIEKAGWGETVSDVLGRSVDDVLATFGNDAAQQRLDATPAGQAEASRERADQAEGELNKRQAEELDKYYAGKPSAYDHIPLPDGAKPRGRVTGTEEAAKPESKREPAVPDRPIILREPQSRVYDPFRERRDRDIVVPTTIDRPAAAVSDMPAAPPAPTLTEAYERIERERTVERETTSPAAATPPIQINAPISIQADSGTNVDQLTRDLTPAMERAAQTAIDRREAAAARRRRTSLHE